MSLNWRQTSPAAGSVPTLIAPGTFVSMSANVAEPSSSAVHAGESTAHHLLNSSAFGADRIGAAEREALVAHHGEDLRVGELAAARAGHRALGLVMCGATRALRVAVDLHAGRRVGIAAVVDPAQLVLDVRERLQHLALRELVADAAFAVACRGSSSSRCTSGAVAEWAAAIRSVVGVRARTYMNAHSGSVAERGDRPERDLLARSWRRRRTGMSGLGGGGPTGAAGAAAGVGAAGAAAAVVAGAVPGVVPQRRGASAGGVPPSAWARAAWLRFSRCSGISVTGAHDRRRDVEIEEILDVEFGDDACTSSQPVDCSTSSVVDRSDEPRLSSHRKWSRTTGVGDYSLCSSSRGRTAPKC